MPIATSIPELDRLLGAELTRMRQDRDQRMVEDSHRYHILKSAIVGGDARMLNELRGSREKFDEIVDRSGKDLADIYFKSRKRS
ncbi:MAG: hypothetical protein V3573_14630 [Desulfovibrionaceae bacterium]